MYTLGPLLRFVIVCSSTACTCESGDECMGHLVSKLCQKQLSQYAFTIAAHVSGESARALAVTIQYGDTNIVS